MFMPMIFQYMLTIQNAAGFLGSNSSQCGLAAFRCYLHPAIQPLRRGFVVGPLCYPTTSKWCRVLYLATPFLFSSHFSHTFCLMTIFLTWLIIISVCFTCCCSNFSTEHFQTSKDASNPLGFWGTLVLAGLLLYSSPHRLKNIRCELSDDSFNIA